MKSSQAPVTDLDSIDVERAASAKYGQCCHRTGAAVGASATAVAVVVCRQPAPPLGWTEAARSTGRRVNTFSFAFDPPKCPSVLVRARRDDFNTSTGWTECQRAHKSARHALARHRPRRRECPTIADDGRLLWPIIGNANPPGGRRTDCCLARSSAARGRHRLCASFCCAPSRRESSGRRMSGE